MQLGKTYSSKITDGKQYERLITEIDFKNRSVLKIIAENKFERLLDENDPKAENMMMGIWQGKESNKCDGTLSGFSSLNFIMSSHYSSKFKKYSPSESGFSLEDLDFFCKASNCFKVN